MDKEGHDGTRLIFVGFQHVHAIAVDKYSLALAQVRYGRFDLDLDLAVSHDTEMYFVVPVPIDESAGKVLEFRIVGRDWKFVASVMPRVFSVYINGDVDDIQPGSPPHKWID